MGSTFTCTPATESSVTSTDDLPLVELPTVTSSYKFIDQNHLANIFDTIEAIEPMFRDAYHIPNTTQDFKTMLKKKIEKVNDK